MSKKHPSHEVPKRNTGPAMVFRRQTPPPGSEVPGGKQVQRVNGGLVPEEFGQELDLELEVAGQPQLQAELCSRCQVRTPVFGGFCSECAEVQSSLSRIAVELSDDLQSRDALFPTGPQSGGKSTPSSMFDSPAGPGSLLQELLVEVQQLDEPSAPFIPSAAEELLDSFGLSDVPTSSPLLRDSPAQLPMVPPEESFVPDEPPNQALAPPVQAPAPPVQAPAPPMHSPALPLQASVAPSSAGYPSSAPPTHPPARSSRPPQPQASAPPQRAAAAPHPVQEPHRLRQAADGLPQDPRTEGPVLPAPQAFAQAPDFVPGSFLKGSRVPKAGLRRPTQTQYHKTMDAQSAGLKSRPRPGSERSSQSPEHSGGQANDVDDLLQDFIHGIEQDEARQSSKSRLLLVAGIAAVLLVGAGVALYVLGII